MIARRAASKKAPAASKAKGPLKGAAKHAKAGAVSYTHLDVYKRQMCALAKAFVFAGYSVKATTTLAMLNSIHDSYNGSEHDGVRRFCEVDILFLDDIGKENANSWALTTLFEVVNYRYENMLPTVFTSQYLSLIHIS